jgi:hypothetical protein
MTNVFDQRADAGGEREQVDRRLDDRGEGRGLPVAPEQHDVAGHHAGHRSRLEATHAANRRGSGGRGGRYLGSRQAPEAISPLRNAAWQPVN